MKLGLNVMRPSIRFGLWGADLADTTAMVKRAEALGYDSAWTAEASGTDAITPLAWLAAQTSTIKLGTSIMQIAARSPSMTAMTAATMDLLSGSRFLLGLGVSGAAVVEGWHSQAYGHPLQKTAEYVEVVRKIMRRDTPVQYHGNYYDIPYGRPDSTGLAQPIKLMFRPPRRLIPIYLAAMGERNVQLALRIADGVLPAFYSPFKEDVFFAGTPASNRQGFEVAPFVYIAVGDDLEACRDRVRPGFAFWFGVMGSKRVNYYNEFVQRLGYEGVARRVSKLYLDGRPGEAARNVTNELIDEMALCGPPERIRDLLEPWKESSVTTMICSGMDQPTMELMAELVL